MSALCRRSALRFLKIRPRSVGELRDKLATKGFEAKEIDATIEWLQDNRLIDDRAFTSSWIQYRLARPFGFRRIIAELKAKRVAEEIIQEAIAKVQEDYSQEATVMQVAKRRWERFASVEPQKRRKRIYDYLLRRGFTPEEVMKAIKKL